MFLSRYLKHRSTEAQGKRGQRSHPFLLLLMVNLFVPREDFRPYFFRPRQPF